MRSWVVQALRLPFPLSVSIITWAVGSLVSVSVFQRLSHRTFFLWGRQWPHCPQTPPDVCYLLCRSWPCSQAFLLQMCSVLAFTIYRASLKQGHMACSTSTEALERNCDGTPNLGHHWCWRLYIRMLPALPGLRTGFLILFPLLPSPRENTVFKKSREDGEAGEGGKKGKW